MSSNDPSAIFHKTYAATPSDLTSAPLDDTMLLAIARLVRAVAELEHCATCFIANLAPLSEAQTNIILGKTTISARINIAKQLATLRKDQALSRHNAVFSREVEALISCRNILAHGAYLGRDKDGGYAFLSDQSQFSEYGFGQTVNSYTAETVRGYADLLEASLPEIERLLHIEPLRGKRPPQGLRPHPKAQPSRPPSAKQKPPPESSQG